MFFTKNKDKDFEIEIFKNEDFGEIRTIEENGKVLFCATDIARSLGYSNPHDAISRHCKGVVKREGVSKTTNQHGTTTQQITKINFIPEGDVYRLITHSKLSSAEKFESWIFDEVLPTIRKTGGYVNSADLMVNTYFSDIPNEQQTIVRGLLSNIEEKTKENRFFIT